MEEELPTAVGERLSVGQGGERLIAYLEELTPRAPPNREIAVELVVAESTIGTHVKRRS
jgi:hypothetical protein